MFFQLIDKLTNNGKCLNMNKNLILVEGANCRKKWNVKFNFPCNFPHKSEYCPVIIEFLAHYFFLSNLKLFFSYL